MSINALTRNKLFEMWHKNTGSPEEKCRDMKEYLLGILSVRDDDDKAQIQKKRINYVPRIPQALDCFKQKTRSIQA